MFESDSRSDGRIASPKIPTADLDRLFGRVRREPSYAQERPRDAVAQCPNCKTMETVQFLGDKLMRSRKFFQTDGKVYHDCGSKLPCRISM